MGLPFSKIIQNNQEYDVSVPAPSTYTITANTRIADISSLIENSIAKGFIPYIRRIQYNESLILNLYQFEPNGQAMFTTCTMNPSYPGITGDIRVRQLIITRYDETVLRNIAVNKDTTSDDTDDLNNVVLYYK